MEMIKVIKLAADLLSQGKDLNEIKAELFRTKGVRVGQIEKVMELIA